jgi:hypothetical protein
MCLAETEIDTLLAPTVRPGCKLAESPFNISIKRMRLCAHIPHNPHPQLGPGLGLIYLSGSFNSQALGESSGNTLKTGTPRRWLRAVSLHL